MKSNYLLLRQHPSLFGFANGATGIVLGIVRGVHAGNFRAVQLWPQEPPVVGPQFLARYGSLGSEFQTDAVFGTWRAIRITMSPLPQLRIALDDVTKGRHAQTQLGNAERTGRGEVLVECHGFALVANGSSVEAHATHVKHQSLRVACATLPS
jgi:hypothetical protein